MSWQKNGKTKGAVVNLKKSGGAVAQLGARLDGIEEVVGSNPIGSTNFKKKSQSLPLLKPLAVGTR